MNFRKTFQSFVLLPGLVMMLSMAAALEVSATPVEEYTIPGQDALEEIEQETVVIGGEQNTPEYSIPSNKVSISYSGKIDASTGEAAIGHAVNVGEDYYILKNGELAYNVRKSQYHILCGSRGLYCNVPSDAILSQGKSFQIFPDEGVTVEVSFNGERIEDQNQTHFYESGEYLLYVYNHAEAREGRARIVILEKTEHDFKEFRLPQGFEFTEVLLDGVKKSVSYNNYYDFLEEGHYQLTWANSRIRQTFTTEFDLDFTAPTLKLPEVLNGTATGQVSFADMEEGEYVRWIRDSKEEGRIEDPSEVLSEYGSYVIRVYDQAGNYTQYEFVLEGYFDVNAMLAILSGIALISGGFFYCRRLRTHMRVG
ncbi:MAG: hypothetical protein IKV59_09325 [Lachnospiraceae bacterium]|nr:hypothetical protein [Lachnospiraceae bacterium]